MTPILIVFCTTLLLFIWNRIPMGTVSLMAILALLLLKTISPSEAYGFICNNTTLTMASMFVLSSALVKTSCISALTSLTQKIASRSFRGLMTSYVLLAFLLSQFIPSITSVFAMLCPIIISISEKMNIKPGKILYSVALVITVSAYTLTPIGPYAANYIENNNLQLQYGIQTFINTPFTEMLIKLPPALFAIFWGIFIAPSYGKNKDEKICTQGSAPARPQCSGSACTQCSDSVYTQCSDSTQNSAPARTRTQGSAPGTNETANSNLSAPGKNTDAGSAKNADTTGTKSCVFPPRGTLVPNESSTNTLTPFQNVSTPILFILSIISLVVSPFGLANWIIPCIASCLVICTGVLSEKEAISSLNLSIIIIYAGTSALGAALVRSGVAEKIGDLVISLLAGTHNSYVIGFVFFSGAFICTSLIYNRAVGRILIPIVLSTCYAIHADPRGLVQMCYIGSMCSLITPASTTLVPMLTENAGFTERDLLRMGILPSLLLCAVTVLCGMTMYPCF